MIDIYVISTNKPIHVCNIYQMYMWYMWYLRVAYLYGIHDIHGIQYIFIYVYQDTHTYIYIHILVFVYLTGSISVGLRVLQHIIFDDSSFYLMKHQVLIDMVPTKHTSKIGSDDSTYRGGNGGNRLPLYLLHLEWSARHPNLVVGAKNHPPWNSNIFAENWWLQFHLDLQLYSKGPFCRMTWNTTYFLSTVTYLMTKRSMS